MNHIYSDQLTLQKKVAYSQGIIAISKKNKFYFLEIQYTMERLIYETEFILFQIHDKIVGFLIYSEEKPIFSIPIPTSVPKGMFQDLQFLFIYPEERGKGYGSSLVDLYLKKMGCNIISGLLEKKYNSKNNSFVFDIFDGIVNGVEPNAEVELKLYISI